MVYDYLARIMYRLRDAFDDAAYWFEVRAPSKGTAFSSPEAQLYRAEFVAVFEKRLAEIKASNPQQS